mmetsp:Transcript_27963/g.65295  ORF Transcript_27963/g.65295 Transcript_27963/m.65295 type:complete len:215 (+) Transcript_27963:896-1540(+)
MGVAMGPLPVHGRRSDPLVLDHQLARDCAAADRHRGDDHDAHAEARLQPIQRAGQGGFAGGERLEARACGRLPPTRHAHLAVRFARHGRAVACHVGHLHLVRDAGLPLACQPRQPAHCHHPRLHAHGRAGRVHLIEHVQVAQGRRVEEDDRPDGDALPWHRLRHLLHPQFLHLGAGFFGRHPLHHHDSAAPHVVRHLGAARLRGRLLRLQGQAG